MTGETPTRTHAVTRRARKRGESPTCDHQRMTTEDRPVREPREAVILHAMPLPAMYEFLRENLDFAGAVTAARRVLADDRATKDESQA